MLTRRDFLWSAGAFPALSGFEIPTDATPDGVVRPPFRVTILPQRGYQEDPGTIHVRQLCAAAFDQLCRDLIPFGKTFRVVDGYRVGDRGVTHQWNTGWSYNLGAMTHRPDEFDRFLTAMSGWSLGNMLVKGGPVKALDAFGPRTLMAMPPLPFGLTWAANYLEEQSGVVMRGLAIADVMTDEHTLRFDVLCGG